jgi:small nuclear ribonucleoprotein (snRNP)-like protein
MNVVLEEAFEILQDSKEKKIGKVLIRGDSVILIYQTLFKK